MNKYETRYSAAWDKAPDQWQWAVFGPSAFAFGEVVALFVKKEHAERFTEEMNQNRLPPVTRDIDDVLEGLLGVAERAAQHDFVRSFVKDESPQSLFHKVRALSKWDPLKTVYGWDEASVDPVVLLQGKAENAYTDDVCAALAAVFVAAGHECRIAAHAYDPKGEHFVNAVVEVKIQDRRFPCDALSSEKFGELAKEPTAIKRSGEIVPIPMGDCPFCGAVPEMVWEREWVFVQCSACHARGPAVGKGSGRVSKEYLIKEAVAGWNLGARS